MPSVVPGVGLLFPGTAATSAFSHQSPAPPELRLLSASGGGFSRMWQYRRGPSSVTWQPTKRDESDSAPSLQGLPDSQGGDRDRRYVATKATHRPASSERVKEGFLEEAVLELWQMGLGKEFRQRQRPRDVVEHGLGGRQRRSLECVGSGMQAKDWDAVLWAAGSRQGFGGRVRHSWSGSRRDSVAAGPLSLLGAGRSRRLSPRAPTVAGRGDSHGPLRL